MNIQEAVKEFLRREEEHPEEYLVIYSPSLKNVFSISRFNPKEQGTKEMRHFTSQGDWRELSFSFVVKHFFLDDYRIGTIDELGLFDDNY